VTDDGSSRELGRLLHNEAVYFPFVQEYKKARSIILTAQINEIIILEK